MATILGIDLGTTFSAMATIDETGRPVIVNNDEGHNITPSCIAEIEPNVFMVGEEARKTWGVSPNQAAARFKRDMGTSKTHTINNKEFTPTQLSAMVLKKLVNDATKVLGDNISDVVVTIPANFSNEAREETMSAAKEAGLNVKYIINEPTAAALYYSFKHGEELHGNYAVYDLGGGTFDVSIIKVDGQNVSVLATNGIHKFGGTDFDKVLQELGAKKYKELTGTNMEPDYYNLNEAEEDKKSLSKRKSVTLGIKKPLIKVTVEEFEEAISHLITQAEMVCESTIEEAKLTPSDVKAVFLAGGSTRVPLVKESIKRVFQQEPTETVNVDEVVTLGAALYAAYKGDQSNLSAAQKNAINKIKVSESTSKCFGTISLGHDEHRDEIKPTNSILIHKGEKIPCSKTELFYTTHDGQEAVQCKITESTAPETDPRFVKIIWEGKLELPPGRPADQEIKITFAYDDNQIIKCSFLDVETNKKTEVDLSMGANKEENDNSIEKFMVE